MQRPLRFLTQDLPWAFRDARECWSRAKYGVGAGLAFALTSTGARAAGIDATVVDDAIANGAMGGVLIAFSSAAAMGTSMVEQMQQYGNDFYRHVRHCREKGKRMLYRNSGLRGL